MVSVLINGSESGIAGNGLSRLAELVELIKASIDPDHMITSILVDGRELSDSEWGSAVSQFGTSIIEIQTDTPDRFVDDRMACAGDVVRTCYFEFRDARKCFQSGDMVEGNQRLLKAVNTARAFFDWYASIMQLTSEEKRAQYAISGQVTEITEICKRLCQQQLYQSWWALGETLEKELEPKLDKLEDFCRKFQRQV